MAVSPPAVLGDGLLDAGAAGVPGEPAFGAAFEMAANAMILARVDDAVLRVVAVNPACRSAGLGEGALGGRAVAEVLAELAIPEAHREQLVGACIQALSEGRAERVEGAFVGSRPAWFGSAGCTPIDGAGGGALVLLASLDAMSGDGRRAGVGVGEHDVTLSRAFQLSPAALSVSRLGDGRFLDVNEACCKLFEYSREEFIGHHPLELQLWDRTSDREQFFEQLLQTGSVHDLEIVIRTRRGARLTVLFSAERVHVGGEECMVASIHDMTAERQAERMRRAVEARARQTQRLEALGVLAGGIAHDFNNLLTIFTALADLAEADVERPEALREHLADLRKTTDRALALVRQVLTFSRRQRDDRRVLDLRGVVVDGVAMLRRTLPSSIEIVTHVSDDAVLVHASADQLHQVLINLCTNAAHAMRARHGTLTIELAPIVVEGCESPPELGQGWHARLLVRDEGEGMDERTVARIFEPFFTTKGPGEGTGLGLAVVHGIVHDHGGALEVTSRVGEGTAMAVYLPLHVGPVDTVERESRAVPRGNGERVLIVDDEHSVGQAFAGLLARLGYHATAFDDPLTALDRFRETPEEFDVVVTDLTMAHMTGDVLAREIHALRPDLPILLMTGYSANLTRSAAREIGALDLLSKPVEIGVLAAAIHRALARAHDAQR